MPAIHIERAAFRDSLAAALRRAASLDPPAASLGQAAARDPIVLTRKRAPPPKCIAAPRGEFPMLATIAQALGVATLDTLAPSLRRFPTVEVRAPAPERASARKSFVLEEAPLGREPTLDTLAPFLRRVSILDVLATALARASLMLHLHPVDSVAPLVSPTSSSPSRKMKPLRSSTISRSGLPWSNVSAASWLPD